MSNALKLAAGIAVALVLLRLLVLALEPRVTFFPPGDLPWSPGEAGLPWQAIEAPTSDGLALRGWFIPAPDRGEAHPQPAPAILVFHGNAETIAHGLDLARRARGAGFATILAEYRGYGGNPGSPSEAGIGRDGEAFLRAAAAHPAVDAGRMILWGRSIGAAVAVQLAARGEGAALVLESPFTSARDLLRDDGAWLFLALSWLGSYRFDSASRMPSVRAPVLVIHGTRDTIAPFAHGRRLHDLAAGPRSFLEIEGGGHNDLWALHGDALWGGALEFLHRAVPPQPG